MRLLNWLKQFIGLILGPLFILFTLGVVGFVAIWAYYTSQLDSKEYIRANIGVQLPLKIFSKDQQLIAEFGQYRRRPVKIADIPPHLAYAFIAIEDARFYKHKGVDPRGVARVIVNAIKTGSASQGASTITMQVARNFFLNRKKKLDRKLKEVFLAGRLESMFSKDQILELYLNKIFLGKRSYGIGSAAEVYYGKTVDQLTLAQSAMIAGLPKAPTAYNPIVNPKRALKRRNYILKRMKELDPALIKGRLIVQITDKEYEEAINEPLSAKVHARAKTETDAPYVAEMVRQEIIKKYGADEAYRTGMRVYTTIDSDEQAHAAKSLRENLIKYHKRHGYYGPEATIELSEFTDDIEGKKRLLKKLNSYHTYGGLIPAVVTSSSKEEAQLTTATGETAVLSLKKLSWARKHINERKRGKKPTSVKDVLNVGDIVRLSKSEEDNWEFTPLPKISGAIVSMNPKDGAILAAVGGFDFRQSKFNRATQAKRQPGSSFKPFVYSAALAKGYSPASVVNDAPIKMRGWRPKNYSGKNYGPTRLREGLKKSRNLVSIQLLREISVPYVHQYVQKYGFNPKEVPQDLTMALGTGSVTPVQMAGAYSTFANGGYKVSPYFISHIISNKGEVMFKQNPATACPECDIEKETTLPENTDSTALTTEDTSAPSEIEQTSEVTNTIDPDMKRAERIMKPYVRYEIVSMLQTVARSGTAARTRVLKRNDLAGKTGTTNDQKDAWFAGFAPKKVAIVWIGFDQIQPMGRRETATGLALPTWIDFMKVALKDTPETPLVAPKGMITVNIDKFSGFRADQTTLEVINETLTREQIPNYVPNDFLTEDIENTTFVRVNNPVNPTISMTDEEAMDAGLNDYGSDASTRTIMIDNERFEIPEQLF